MTIVLNGLTGINAPSSNLDSLSVRGANEIGLFALENKIINGCFDLWRRGNSFSANGYGAERWESNFGGGAFTQNLQSFQIGDLIAGNDPETYMRIAVSGQTASTHLAVLQQKIEGVRSYAGQTITVLGWARRAAGNGDMSISMDQFFGTGGTFSNQENGPGQRVSLTTQWQPFAVVVNVPSITGKLIGTALNDALILRIWASAGSDFNARTANLGLQTITIDLWGLHIRMGAQNVSCADLFRAPDVTLERIRASRYFVNGYYRNRHLATGADVIRYHVPFDIPMRGTPTVVLSGGANTNVTGVFPSASFLGFTVLGTVSGSGTVIVDYASNFTSDAEL